MKTFEKMAAQGDFIIRRIEKIPADVVAVKPVDGVIVVAHSETGHNHVMEATHVKAFDVKTEGNNVDIYRMFLSVDQSTPIEHLRSFDTHSPIMVAPGNYEVRRQREYTPQGFRRAAD